MRHNTHETFGTIPWSNYSGSVDYYGGLNTCRYYFGVPDYSYSIVNGLLNPILTIKALTLALLARTEGSPRPKQFSVRCVKALGFGVAGFE